jgi:hypothetical protein
LGSDGGFFILKITPKKFERCKLAEVGILQNNHLQTGWGMSTSPTRILADFDDNATSIIRNGDKNWRYYRFSLFSIVIKLPTLSWP